MALKVKIDPVERVTAATVLGETVAIRKAAAAQFARDGIEEAKRTNRSVLGRVPPYSVTVDGREGAPLDSVNPDRGSIDVEFELFVDLLVWIGQTLVERSPKRSGRYRRGWALFADGIEVPIDASIPPADKYVFVNLEPYSRKIEIGRTHSGRAFVIQVPNRIAERTAKDARSRFGNQAKIVYGFESVQSGGAITRWARSTRSRRRRRRDWLTRQPAVIVYAKER
jgi:hypothetical protein